MSCVNRDTDIENKKAQIQK